MIKLRDYQQSSVNKVYSLWNSSIKNVLLVEPTGAGKTFIKGQFARDRMGKKGVTIIFAHRDVLLSQISLSLAEMGVTHSFIAVNKTIKDISDNHINKLGKSFYEQTSNIIVASVDTYIRRLEKGKLNNILDLVELWMLDEAHHCLKDNKWGKCVNSFPNAIGLGVTATPIRTDKLGLGVGASGVFNEMIVGSTTGQLIEKEFLSSYRIFVPPSLINMNGVNKTKSGEWNQKQLAEKTDRKEITGDSVKQYRKFANGLQTITFCVNIAHSNHVAKEFNKAGIKSVSLSSKTNLIERNNVIKRFKEGKIMNLVNCDLFGEGFDCPAVSCVIMLRKTESYSLFKQQFGRMLRVIDGKECGILIDQVGNVKRHCVHGEPHDDPIWSLKDSKKNFGDNEVITSRVCPECFSYYIPNSKTRFVCKDCNHEETVDEINDQFQLMINDDTDLVEMSVNFVSTLMKEKRVIDLPTNEYREKMITFGQTGVVLNSNVSNHSKRKLAQEKLRRKIQSYGLEVMKERRLNLKSFQMLFEKKFRINILKAQVLSERKSLELLEEIEND